MSQFKDTYGILALAATTKKITPKKGTDKLGKFSGALEKILVTVNSKLIDREQCTMVQRSLDVPNNFV